MREAPNLVNLRQQSQTPRLETKQREHYTIQDDYRNRNCRSVNSASFKKYIKNFFLNG